MLVREIHFRERPKVSRPIKAMRLLARKTRCMRSELSVKSDTEPSWSTGGLVATADTVAGGKDAVWRASSRKEPWRTRHPGTPCLSPLLSAARACRSSSPVLMSERFITVGAPTAGRGVTAVGAGRVGPALSARGGSKLRGWASGGESAKASGGGGMGAGVSCCLVAPLASAVGSESVGGDLVKASLSMPGRTSWSRTRSLSSSPSSPRTCVRSSSLSSLGVEVPRAIATACTFSRSDTPSRTIAPSSKFTRRGESGGGRFGCGAPPKSGVCALSAARSAGRRKAWSILAGLKGQAATEGREAGEGPGMPSESSEAEPASLPRAESLASVKTSHITTRISGVPVRLNDMAHSRFTLPSESLKLPSSGRLKIAVEASSGMREARVICSMSSACAPRRERNCLLKLMTRPSELMVNLGGAAAMCLGRTSSPLTGTTRATNAAADRTRDVALEMNILIGIVRPEACWARMIRCALTTSVVFPPSW
mmetsp:Transcript_13351/g.30738  ORF Transcript_13351/g.30738 Transcript_13351/m.30738 type:complete len:482 (-) Transcript_13351:2001-3446(-)